MFAITRLALVERAREHRAILILIALAIVVRIGLMYLYFPALLLAFDSPRYARVGGAPMFGDFWMPAGYPFFLCLLRSVTVELWVTTAVQHALGVATGVFLYIALIRLPVRHWVACIPAAAVFFSGDQLYLEHSPMADFFLTFCAAGGFLAAVVWLTKRESWWWLGLASAVFAYAALVRSVGVALLAVLAFVAVLAGRNGPRDRIVAICFAVTPAVLIFGLYFAVFWLSGGRYLGISDMRGWNLYSRVAPFADCSKFTPPKGTEVLCEARAPSERPGPFGYVWDLQSVPRRTFELGPETGRKLEKFAYAVIRHQPADYARAVLLDLARFVEPSLDGNRPLAGQPREIISFGWRDAEVESMVVRAMASDYRGTEVTVRAQTFLGAYQQYVSIRCWWLVPLVFSTLVGVWCARENLRFAILLYGLGALGLFALPVLTLSYDFRYGIPPTTFLFVAGILGAVACRDGLAKS